MQLHSVLFTPPTESPILHTEKTTELNAINKEAWSMK